MHIHILGICGTFMGGIAALAAQQGHRVTGCDANVYPPMSSQLETLGIELIEGFSAEQTKIAPDCYLIGNALSRGNPLVEAILNQNLPYTSGPEWLAENLLRQRQVIAVSGTHGKTTTTSMVAHILDKCGYSPGFLVGGIPNNFGLSARLGKGSVFVVEADEYDTAFFDKRSKFIHYHPRVLVMNNLEFDHADIFADLAAIQTQFHHLIRIVPGEGQIIYPALDENISQVLAQGCWSQQISFGFKQGMWQAQLDKDDGTEFQLSIGGEAVASKVHWSQMGEHNVMNGLAALIAASQVGVPVGNAVDALNDFSGVKRRLELIADIENIKVYDDFAHHPTAVEQTLLGVRKHSPNRRIIALLEPRSNTMRMGVHRSTLARSLNSADVVLLYNPPELSWDLSTIVTKGEQTNKIFDELDAVVDYLTIELKPNDSLVIMSNGGFGSIHQRIVDNLKVRTN